MTTNTTRPDAPQAGDHGDAVTVGPSPAWHATAVPAPAAPEPTGPWGDDANPANWTLAERARARVVYIAWRLRCRARAFFDGGSVWGCCTCGGTSGTWRITGATAMRGVEGEPVEDWTECDRCYQDGKEDAGPVGARRDVTPLPHRAVSWLLMAAFLVALIGAAGTPTPFASGLAATILAIAAALLWGGADRLVQWAAHRRGEG